ncbi:MAG: transcriptional regulator [Marmoricola sp.]|nr:transcriptional regulator [Marmoricola sp.]
MSTPYEETGRANQKQRTRNALITAARDLIAGGGSSPTVEEAAAAASVSRTTAYRYFPSQRDLLVAAHPEVDTVSLLPLGVGDDPEERLLTAVRAFNKLIVETEQQQRTMLRLSLEAEAPTRNLPLRQGRAVGWFADALGVLEPELSKAEVRRLAVAVRSVVGVETLVWLTDVAGLSRKRANDLMEWSAKALLRQALAGDLP